MLVTRLCMSLRDCGTTVVRTCCSVHNGVSAHSNKYLLSPHSSLDVHLRVFYPWRAPASSSSSTGSRARGAVATLATTAEKTPPGRTQRGHNCEASLSLSVSLCAFLYKGILCAISSISLRVCILFCRSSLLFWSCWKLLRRLDAAPVRGISFFLLLSLEVLTTFSPVLSPPFFLGIFASGISKQTFFPSRSLIFLNILLS